MELSKYYVKTVSLSPFGKEVGFAIKEYDFIEIVEGESYEIK